MLKHEIGNGTMLRGWVGPSRYLSERKQRALLVAAGVEERVIYPPDQWAALVKSLRPEAKDKAAVADLRIFGSRRQLVEAVKAVEAKGSKLVVVESGTELDAPTLHEVDRTLTRWRGEAAIKSRAQARKLGKRGAAARAAKIETERLAKDGARTIWLDLKKYPEAWQALIYMPGWTRTTAWRHFGPREKN
jgi:hypothetical protein